MPSNKGLWQEDREGTARGRGGPQGGDDDHQEDQRTAEETGRKQSPCAPPIPPSTPITPTFLLGQILPHTCWVCGPAGLASVLLGPVSAQGLFASVAAAGQRVARVGGRGQLVSQEPCGGVCACRTESQRDVYTLRWFREGPWAWTRAGQ